MPRKPRQPSLFEKKSHARFRGRIIIAAVKREGGPDPDLFAKALLYHLKPNDPIHH